MDSCRARSRATKRTDARSPRPAGNNSFALSAISIFEVALKVRKGKIDLRLPLDQWLDLALDRSLIIVFPIDAEIARGANMLPEPFHEDPADRLIAATARLRNLTLVTSDEKILRYAHLQLFDTR